eukprot:354670-Chlamydomonas_euryale.AAC.2
MQLNAVGSPPTGSPLIGATSVMVACFGQLPLVPFSKKCVPPVLPSLAEVCPVAPAKAVSIPTSGARLPPLC